MQDYDVSTDLNHNAKQSSQGCTGNGLRGKIGKPRGSQRVTFEEAYLCDHKNRGYKIVKAKGRYLLKRGTLILFSGETKEAMKDLFINIIKYNGGFL